MSWRHRNQMRSLSLGQQPMSDGSRALRCPVAPGWGLKVKLGRPLGAAALGGVPALKEEATIFTDRGEWADTAYQAFFATEWRRDKEERRDGTRWRNAQKGRISKRLHGTP